MAKVLLSRGFVKFSKKEIKKKKTNLGSVDFSENPNIPGLGITLYFPTNAFSVGYGIMLSRVTQFFCIIVKKE